MSQMNPARNKSGPQFNSAITAVDRPVPVSGKIFGCANAWPFLFPLHTQPIWGGGDMKMHNNPDLMDIITRWIAAHRLEFGYGGIAGIIAWLRGRYNEKPFRRCFLDALMCAAIAFAVRDVLDFFGLSTDLAYISSVIIGYLGTDYLSSLFKWKVTGRPIEEGKDNDK